MGILIDKDFFKELKIAKRIYENLSKIEESWRVGSFVVYIKNTPFHKIGEIEDSGLTSDRLIKKGVCVRLDNIKSISQLMTLIYKSNRKDREEIIWCELVEYLDEISKSIDDIRISSLKALVESFRKFNDQLTQCL